MGNGRSLHLDFYKSIDSSAKTYTDSIWNVHKTLGRRTRLTLTPTSQNNCMVLSLDILEDPSKFYEIIMIVPYQFEIWMHAYVFKIHLYDWVLIIVIDNTSKACKSRKFSKGGGGAEG